MSSEQQHWYEQITPLESNKIGSSKDIAEKLDLVLLVFYLIILG